MTPRSSLPLILRIGLFLIIVAWAVSYRLSYAFPPIADPDTYGYLCLSVFSDVDGRLALCQGRSIVYPAFLFVFLRMLGTYDAVAVFQHVLAIIGGGLLFCSWHQLRAFLPRNPLLTCWHELLGYPMLWLYFSSSVGLFYEHSLRPEALLPFLLSALIFLVVGYARRFSERRAFTLYGAGIVFVAFVTYLAVPRFGLALPFCLIPLGVTAYLASGMSVREKLRTLVVKQTVVPLLVVIVFFILPQRYLQRNDLTAALFLPEVLFATHANMALPLIKADLESGTPPFPREILQQVYDTVHAETERIKLEPPPGLLQWIPDMLIYRNTTCARVREFYGADTESQVALYHHYFFGVIRHSFPQFARKVVLQLSHYYVGRTQLFPPLEFSFGHLSQYGRNSLESQRTFIERSRGGIAYLADLETYSQVGKTVREPYFTRFLFDRLRDYYLVLAIAAVLAALFFSFVPVRVVPRVCALLVIFLNGWSFSLAFTCALLFHLEVNRYLETLMPLNLFLSAANMLFIGLVLVAPLSWWLRRTTRETTI